MKWTIEFWQTSSGRSQVQEFLLSLPEDDRVTVAIVLDDLAELGTSLLLRSDGVLRKMGGIPGAFELRRRISQGQLRIFLAFGTTRVVIVEAIIKKSKKTPKGTVELVRSRVQYIT